ncbi:hypothetical protein AB2N08_10130 [Massilia aurea]|uniref:hypothetical protein n=1 Tax=Massilia aurea TaxID=373040 RepID=UPI00346367BB
MQMVPPKTGRLAWQGVLLAVAGCWHGVAGAGEALPSHLTGTWGTAESLYVGNTGQTDLHLAADGVGIMVGSTPPPQRISGVDDGTPPPRALIGFPVRATLGGTVLTVRPMALDPKDAARAARSVVTCSIDLAGPTLTCVGPKGPAMVMRRRSAVMSGEEARMLAELRPHFPPAAAGD